MNKKKIRTYLIAHYSPRFSFIDVELKRKQTTIELLFNQKKYSNLL